MSSVGSVVDLLVVGAVGGPTVYKRPDIVELTRRLPVGIYELTRGGMGTL